MKRGLLAVLVGMAVVSSLLADDWPQFRGPDRSGVSKEKGLLKAWPKGGPKLDWTFKDAGLGCSSVAVVKGVVYTLGTDFDAKLPKSTKLDEFVIAINEKDGKELWRHKIGPISTFPPGANAYGDGPRSTPAIDGDLLFALSGNGQLVCLDLKKEKDKREVWRKHLVKDLGGIMPKYGYSECPLIDGDKLVCTPGGPKGTLAALKKTTGEVIWYSKGLTNLAQFSSMVVADIHGVRQFIQTSGVEKAGDTHGDLSGIDAKTGKVLWTQQIYTGTNEGAAASPVVSGNLVYITVGWGAGCQLFEIDDKQQATEKYGKKQARIFKNTHGGVVLIDGFIYGHSERESWVCQELKSGNEKWTDEDELKAGSGAITAADGKLYLFTEDGEVGLAEASPKKWTLISSFKLPVRSAIPKMRTTSRMSRPWAYPVVANGRLYLRDHEYIFAFNIAK